MKNILVVIAQVSHPFPFRTRKLSPAAPMVLCGRLHGRVGHRQVFILRGFSGFLTGPEILLFEKDFTQFITPIYVVVRLEFNTGLC